MELFSILLIMLSLSPSALSQNLPGSFMTKNEQFTIKGTLKSDRDSVKLYLLPGVGPRHPDSQVKYLDSTWIVHDTFSMTGYVDEPGYYSYETELAKGWQSFILENDTYTIPGRLDSIWRSKIDASNTTTLQEQRVYALILNQLIYELNEMSDSIQVHFDLGNIELSNLFGQMNQRLNKRIGLASADFIRYYPDSWVSLLNFIDLNDHIPLERRRRLYEGLSDRLKSHSYSKEILFTLRDSSELMLVGNHIPSDLSYVDKSGKEQQVKDHNKEYLLLDFWASWCQPCRAKYPEMIEFYKNYGDRLEILSISIDSKESNWENALNKDGTPWLQMLDEHQSEKWGRLFNVRLIPSNFLIRRSGEIVGKDMSVDQIKGFLAE